MIWQNHTQVGQEGTGIGLVHAVAKFYQRNVSYETLNLKHTIRLKRLECTQDEEGNWMYDNHETNRQACREDIDLDDEVKLSNVEILIGLIDLLQDEIGLHVNLRCPNVFSKFS